MYCRTEQINRYIAVAGSHGSHCERRTIHKYRITKCIGKTLWCLTGIRSCDTNSGIKRLCTHTPHLCLLSTDKAWKQTFLQGTHLMPKSWFLNPFTTKRNQNSLEKQLIPGLGREKNKLSLGYLLVPENKKVL